MGTELTDELIDAIGDALGDVLPQAIASAIEDKSTEQDDPLVSAVMGIVADFVRVNGPEATDRLAENLKGLIDGTDAQAIHKLYADGLYLSGLVDGLQDAEAARKEDASEMAQTLAVVLKDISKVVVQAALLALRK